MDEIIKEAEELQALVNHATSQIDELRDSKTAKRMQFLSKNIHDWLKFQKKEPLTIKKTDVGCLSNSLR